MSDNTRGAAEASDMRIHFFSANEIVEPSGGARRDRTDDLLLAKQALSQLSYGPSLRSFRSFGSASRAARKVACRAVAAERRRLTRQPSLAARAKAGGPGKI